MQELTAIWILPGRVLACLSILLAAYLIACGVNALFELFSGLQGRGQRSPDSRKSDVVQKTVMPAPGSGLDSHVERRGATACPALPPPRRPHPRRRRHFTPPALTF